MIQNARIRILVVGFAITIGMVAVACHTDAIVSVPALQHDTTANARVGDEVDITLGTLIGPAYDSLPTSSSSVVRFIEEFGVGSGPGGPVQRFRFRAANKGTATIVFVRPQLGQHPLASDTIRDTVVVH